MSERGLDGLYWVALGVAFMGLLVVLAFIGMAGVFVSEAIEGSSCIG